MQKLSSIERLKQKRERLDAQIQSAEARLKITKRKQDTRRKILIGSYYLDLAIKNNSTHELKKIMDGYLTRDSDKKLFESDDIEMEEEKIEHHKKTTRSTARQTEAVS